MNNATYGKPMKNLRNRIDAKQVNNEKYLKSLINQHILECLYKN